MTGIRRVLLATAVVASLASPAALVEAQGGPPAAAQGGDHGRGGYGPGMMGGEYGSGYGPGMMGGYGGSNGPGMMWGSGGFGPGMTGGRGGGPAWSNDATTVGNLAEGQLAFLKAELKITPQQGSLWNHFAATVTANARKMAGERGVLIERDGTNDSLSDRLDMREEIMATALDAMRKTDAALKPLYAALDDGQKQLADRFLGFPMMPFGGMF
jgi:LTXXQ motif family protein